MSEKISEKKTVKLSKTAEKILSALHHSPEMTIAELSLKLGVSSRTVERNLKILQSLHRLKRVGAANGGFWRVLTDECVQAE